MHGEAWVNHAIQEADLLLAFGMRFDDRVTGNLKTYALNAKKIHIDIDPSEINKNVKADAAIVADLRETLRICSTSSSRREHGPWLKYIESMKGDAAVRDIQTLPDNGHLYARARDQRHLAHHRGQGDRRAPTSASTRCGRRSTTTTRRRGRSSPPAVSARWASALPAAIGAKMARPDAEVWAIVGDGGFQMTQAELSHGGAGRRQGQRRHHQQRLPRHGAAVAGVLLRAALRGDAAAQPGLRQARRGARPARPARREARRGRGRRRSGRASAEGTVLIDFRVEQEDSVYPMVPAGADLRRDDPPAGSRRCWSRRRRTRSRTACSVRPSDCLDRIRD